MRISVITPTILRPTLQRTIDAVRDCLLPGDEHIVVLDWLNDTNKDRSWRPTSPYTKWLGIGSPHSVYGNAQRDFGLIHARGDCAVFIDDDDLPHPDGFASLHALAPEPDTIHLYRMLMPNLEMDTNRIETGYIGGPQIVVPARAGHGPTWMQYNEYAADIRYIQHWLYLMEPPMKVVHHREAICRVDRPGQQGATSNSLPEVQ